MEGSSRSGKRQTVAKFLQEMNSSGSKKKLTVVLGASPKPERFSNKAIRLLRQHGHPVIPVHPVHNEIEGLPVAHSIKDIKEPVDTVTLYLGDKASEGVAQDLVALKPARVILNPGAGSAALERSLAQAGIPFEHACTLVMLRAGQF